MSYLLGLPTLPGMLSGYVGFAALGVWTLPAAATAVQIDLSLTSADASDVDVTVTDGTAPITATIPAGDRYSTTAVDVDWAADAELVLIIVAGSNGMGLSGTIRLVDAAQATGTLSSGLVTLAESKTALGITGATGTQDAYLQRRINATSQRIRGYLSHHLTQRDYTDTWYRPAMVRTSAPYLQIITAATQDGNTLAHGEIVADLDSGRLWQPHATEARDWEGTHKLEVSYTAGFADCPPDVKELIFIGLAKQWAGFESSGVITEEPGTVRKEVYQGVGSTEWETPTAFASLPDYITGFPLREVDPWRIIPLGMGSPNGTQIFEVVP